MLHYDNRRCVQQEHLLLLLKSVEVDDDIALLLSCAVLCAVLGSTCTQVTLQFAQILPHWGHCGPVFGFVAAVWRAARRSSEAANQSLTKCARPASQVAFHTTRSLASLQVTRLNVALVQIHFDVANESLLRVADWSLPRWKLTIEQPTGEPGLKHSGYMPEPVQLSL